MKLAALFFRFTRFSRGVFGSMSLGDELKKKAEAGDAVAQYKLGGMYADGDGVQQDSAEAAKWILKSAEQGNIAAQYCLGLIYTGGDGVQQDSAEAAKWYRKSAEQGYARAQLLLGIMV